ncbi:MAG: hypothetical protein ACYTEL_13360 [Planctomycetota bacterium]|jgi:hypothetical protein
MKGSIAGLIVVVCLGVMVSSSPAAVRFDGLIWYHSEDPSRLTLNEDHQLVWYPDLATQITVKLPEMDLSKVGDVADVVYMYKTEGFKTGVPSTDPTLLSGTGDLRIGFFDSNGRGHINSDKTGYRNDKWVGYLGYCARICPHLPVEIEREHSDAIPGKIMKRTKAFDKDVGPSLVQKAGPYGRSRDLSGFGLPLGEFSEFVLRVERKTASTLEFSVTLNGITYIYIDDEAEMQPKKIDAMAMYFPNPNKYTSITFAGCHFSCRPSATGETPRAYVSRHKKNRPDLKK